MSVIRIFFLGIALLGFHKLGLAQNNDAILGTWFNEPQTAKIQLFKRGERYFGKIIWLKEPNDNTGHPRTDKENPNVQLSKRPLIGLEILQNFIFDDDEWSDGKIYDPKSGKTYSCVMNMKGADKLNVRGYIGISLMGRTEVWNRVK